MDADTDADTDPDRSILAMIGGQYNPRGTLLSKIDVDYFAKIIMVLIPTVCASACHVSFFQHKLKSSAGIFTNLIRSFTG